MKKSFLIGALIAAAGLSAPLFANASVYHTYVERAVSSGAPTRIWVFYNCVGRKFSPYSGTAFAEHGTVTYRETLLNRCGLTNVQAREVWYQSERGFTGIDKVTFPRGHGHSEIFAVTVH